MRTATDQVWYRNGTIGHTDEKGQLVLPTPLSEDEIKKLVLEASNSEPSTVEPDRWLDDIHSEIFLPNSKDDAKALIKESVRLPDRRNNVVMSPCQKSRAVRLLKDSETLRLAERTNKVATKGRARPPVVESHRSSVEKHSIVGSPCQRSSGPEDTAEPLIMEPDRSSDKKHSIVRSPCQRSPSPEDTAHPLIMVSDFSSEAKRVVRLPRQRSPSPEDSPELLVTKFDRSTSRQWGVVKSLCEESPRPEGTTEPLIKKSDSWAGEQDEILVSPSPKNSAYSASIHRHSKEYPGFSDSSSDSSAGEATEPTVFEPAYFRPEALRSASTISLYSLQGDADQSNCINHSPSRKSVDRPTTPDSEPHPPTPDQPEEVVEATLSDTISPVSPKHPPLADDIPLVELKKDAPFVNFELHLQHRKQRLRDAQAIFAMPGGDGSSDGGGSLGSGEARRGFSYLDNGTGNLPAKPSCGLC
ncbi:hypothetical protein HII31_09113 [Pseudocercospora fuligena]|uniref:Uncharacterized protein n=1 Tax=Pseudocercospora fuligena TaxID=685502 RepID=A0A8H6REG0_9PEZI|nr:hypothetical protein HII31_09113 [Pseudocercospora fuligena]